LILSTLDIVDFSSNFTLPSSGIFQLLLYIYINLKNLVKMKYYSIYWRHPINTRLDTNLSSNN